MVGFIRGLAKVPCLAIAAISTMGFFGLAPDVLAQPIDIPTPTATLGCGSGVTGIGWSTKSDMPTERYNLGVGVVDGILYAVGGLSDGVTDVVEAYDPATDSWDTDFSSMPTNRFDFGVGVVNGVLYAVGGAGGDGSLRALEAYNPTTDTWINRRRMPTGRRRLSVGVVDGILYALGGGRAGEALDVVEAYDPGTNTWTTKATMPTPRREFAIGVVNGILYAVGGSDGNSVLNSMDAYNPATDTWETMAPMSTARRHLAVGVVDGILYAVGGGRASNIFDAVEAYDPGTNTWRTVTSMPTARRDLAVGVVNGRLYAVGGSNGTAIGANEEGMPLNAPTCVPTAVLSTLGKAVMAPVPATRGTKVCMFYTKAPTSSEMEIYNAAGEKLGKVETMDVNNHCWDTKNAAPGVYFVKIVVKYQDGKSETIWRKAVVIP